MRRYYHYKKTRDFDDYYEAEYGFNGRRAPRSKIMGVCSGLARQFGWDVTVVRVFAVLGLCFFTAPTFLAYIIAGALFY